VRVEDLPGFDPASAHAKIEALGRRLEKIGPVNPLADREYSEASERAAFLQEQCSDLGQSVGELRRVLGDLEHHIETVFAEMFEKTRAHFADMTKTLFPEGRGVLRLQEELATGSTGEVECSNGEDEIPRAESSGRKAPGIHLEIEFPRKGAKTLTLLSGGEKALAAIGFLFSLFLARPCPFYVLDEVEAALDDHNIDRFLSLVKQYQRETQFIIITHQRRTMEIADILYGVTMEGDGVSRLLSRRLTEVRPPGVEAKAG
jgi:chromosome segregation protein